MKPSLFELPFIKPVVNPVKNSVQRAAFATLVLLLSSCGQQFTVSLNDQAVFDPSGRLVSDQLGDADLQGCVNFAMQQQSVELPVQLSVLSCSNSQVRTLDNIGQLTQLRFLDVSNNNISNITPLEELSSISGLNLMNNAITDISVLLNLPTLVSVSLLGNDGISCSQLQLLETRLGENLIRPGSCRN